jgi:hypothetical protein
MIGDDFQEHDDDDARSIPDLTMPQAYIFLE